MGAVRGALYLLVALAAGLYLRETAKAWVIVRQGDLHPKLYGRLPIRLKETVDPFGTTILPVLIAILFASGLQTPPFAYAKPMPQDRGRIRSTKQVVMVNVAGSVANLVVVLLAGLLLRLNLPPEAQLAVVVLLNANLYLAVFHLMPIPGLDGAAILARFLPPRPREVYENLGQYLVLFILAIFFLIGTLLFPIVDALAGAVCRLLAGSAICG
ncbi:MAG: site-2 protease family protein [Actinomycetota bacterium]